MTSRILLIDDDDNLRRVTQYNLKQSGFDVICAASGQEGLTRFRSCPPDLVVSDVALGDMNGLDLMTEMKAVSADIPVIIITAYGSIEMAVRAMQDGAFNFITKPFDRETLRLTCRKALEFSGLRTRNRMLSHEVNRLSGIEDIITAGPVLQDLLETAARAAGSEATILITGESGTGKELLARLIHRNSPRKNGPMVAVNCAAIPPGVMESELFGHVKGAFTDASRNRRGHFQNAAGGTLFLDEIGELITEVQVKLLRAIQEKQVQPVGAERPEDVDFRIIAATNQDMEQLVAEGRFREDLFYRLNVIPLHLPPLRERTQDISALAAHFLKKHKAPASVVLSDGALSLLKSHPWPGNIRELENTIERCIILRQSDTIEPSDLNLGRRPSESTGPAVDIPPEGVSLESVEKAYIQKALDLSNHNKSRAARLLKIPRHVLLYRIEKYGL